MLNIKCGAHVASIPDDKVTAELLEKFYTMCTGKPALPRIEPVEMIAKSVVNACGTIEFYDGKIEWACVR